MAWLLAGTGAALAAGLLSEEPISPLPQQVKVDPRRAALGQRLFHDTRLSRDGAMSCASCHPLDRGGVDGRPLTPTALRPQVQRNTPTVYNAAFNLAQNWDGSARDLAAQAHNVVVGPKQFANTWERALQTVRGDADYRRDFANAYPGREIDEAMVLDAIATFEQTLVTPNAPFDRYLRGQRDALDAVEQEGWRLFKSFGCTACHQGMNVGGNLFQKFGVFAKRPAEAASSADRGRMLVTGDERDDGVYRVPSLRNVALTPPYFHDGSAATLHEAVRVMARVQLDRRLNERETDAIVRFLHTLTGERDGKPLRNAALPEPGARR